VEVASSVPVMSEYWRNERDLRKQAAPQRVSGVLPVRVDMPETSVTFTYKSK